MLAQHSTSNVLKAHPQRNQKQEKRLCQHVRTQLIHIIIWLRITFSKMLHDGHELIHLHPLCRASPQRLCRRGPRQGQFCHHRRARRGGRQRASQEGRIHTVWILSGKNRQETRELPVKSVARNPAIQQAPSKSVLNDCGPRAVHPAPVMVCQICPNYGYDHRNILTIIFTTRSAKSGRKLAKSQSKREWKGLPVCG